jgi:hypothetical protein
MAGSEHLVLAAVASRGAQDHRFPVLAAAQQLGIPVGRDLSGGRWVVAAAASFICSPQESGSFFPAPPNVGSRARCGRLLGTEAVLQCQDSAAPWAICDAPSVPRVAVPQPRARTWD